MKIILIFFMFEFLALSVFGQNNNTNSPSVEEQKLKEKTVKNLELKKEEGKRNNMESAPTPASTKPIMQTESSIQTESFSSSTSSFALKKAKFLAKQFEFNHQRIQRTYSKMQGTELENILQELSVEQPTSFESLLFYYANGQYDLSRSTALLKAYQMNPNDVQVKKEMAIYYFLTNKSDDFRSGLIQVFNSGIYPEAIKVYGTDLINSVSQNGILITHGTEDSFSALYAQKVLRKRGDVKIICLDWLNSPQWREQLKKEGIRLPETNFIDIKYVKEFCGLNAEKNLALSMTIPREYFSPIIQNLYVSGLVFEYKEIPTDNNLNNELLWNTGLDKKLIDTKNHDLVLNYIPMMLQLSSVYEKRNQISSQLEIDLLVEQILQSRGKQLNK